MLRSTKKKEVITRMNLIQRTSLRKAPQSQSLRMRRPRNLMHPKRRNMTKTTNRLKVLILKMTTRPQMETTRIAMTP